MGQYMPNRFIAKIYASGTGVLEDLTSDSLMSVTKLLTKCTIFRGFSIFRSTSIVASSHTLSIVPKLCKQTVVIPSQLWVLSRRLL